MKLIVWLGNPGDNYRFTRHNAGFLFLDKMAYHHDFSFHAEKKFFGDLAQARLHETKVILLKPQTYMNRSWKSIKAAMNFFGIAVQDVLIAHDEIDLASSTIKYKVWWGHAGHNGLRDTITHLGTNDFKRIRIGVGRPSHEWMSVADYVLGKFGEQEFETLLSHYLEFENMVMDFIKNE